MFALVDVNNFYASCEQLFDPRLRGRPLVVLSNNDGCVVARSAEARAIGVKMAAPWHKTRQLVESNGGTYRSSNYALYADMSDRVIEVLSTFSPNIEVYSIDECFLDFDGFADRTAHGQRIRQRVQSWLGLPVCVGIAQTKTLAKLANHIAKKRPQFQGVCDLAAMPQAACDALLADTEVGEVWGVGPKLNIHLRHMGIATVAALRDADPQTLRERFSVVLERTVRELQGIPCADLELTPPAKQEVTSSRTFSGYVRDIETLRAAVSSHASRAAEKLRAQDSVAGGVTVFIQTNRFMKGPQYQRALSVRLPSTSSDTPHLARWALRCLEGMYVCGYDYRKVGVILRDLGPATTGQLSLLERAASKQTEDRRAALNAVLDKVNQKWGRGTAKLSVEAGSTHWHMARERLSPEYTTNWSGLATAS